MEYVLSQQKTQTCLHKIGHEQVARVISAERGDTTAGICTSASGNLVYSWLSFAVRMKMEVVKVHLQVLFLHAIYPVG